MPGYVATLCHVEKFPGREKPLVVDSAEVLAAIDGDPRFCGVRETVNETVFRVGVRVDVRDEVNTVCGAGGEIYYDLPNGCQIGLFLRCACDLQAAQ